METAEAEDIPTVPPSLSSWSLCKAADMPPALLEFQRLRARALRCLLPDAPDELLKRIWPYLAISTVVLQSESGSRYWWAGRYVVVPDLPLSGGVPISRRGNMLLYRWSACTDTRLRGAGVRSRACQTEAKDGEEEWRLADVIFAHKIASGSPHAAKLCVAGPLRSTTWIEVTRESREPRDVLIHFE
eukprot:gnl/TRDRNA2_/TRDRNA2_172887_c2_seq1.p1 gnl/TRDRNA2_/TRDRNA2_172887_c2~~gnl/TRDRNA2_/TRDRNA2_172887_c2_seq1.p1  ORF type:complete len:187 (-),score=23.65 gnl/TRDRNA2_/TRDRNA2_172887_c2_seq1:165-725(-)